MRRQFRRWLHSFRRGPIYRLSVRDLRRIAKQKDFRPLRRIPKAQWTNAIAEVPVPTSGFDSGLALQTLLVLANRRLENAP